MPFGKFGRFPFRFGGGIPVQRTARDAMLVALEPKAGLGYDTKDPLLKAEVEAHAGVISLIWRINARIKNSALPEKMMEALPENETAYGIRPYAEQTDRERRLMVAAKARVLPKNAFPDIEAAVGKLAGAQLVSVSAMPEAETFYFWPQNPGPPGYEWCSNARHIYVVLKKDGLPTDAAFERLRAGVEALVDSLLPVDMTFSVHTGGGFIIGESLIGEDAL